MLSFYDALQFSATKSTIRSGKRIAHRIHYVVMTCKFKRRAGCWITHCIETARNVLSECKLFCKNIIHLNQKRSLTRFRVLDYLLLLLKTQKIMIIYSNCKLFIIESFALTDIVKLLIEMCRRL